MKKLWLSRDGLMPCPSCGAHIRAASGATTCPFCEQAVQRPTSTPTVGRLAGRSAILGAALLGLSACDPDSTDTDTVTQDAMTTEVQPVYGAPADVQPSTDNGAPDIQVQPVYGAPADAGPMPDVQADAPVYGAPADSGPVPFYGAVPVDAG